MLLSGRWKRSKAAWQTCNIRISQVVTGMLFGQPVSGDGGGWDETFSNIWEGVWNAMQAWQWFGAALQPWSRGENQRAWVEYCCLLQVLEKVCGLTRTRVRNSILVSLMGWLSRYLQWNLLG